VRDLIFYSLLLPLAAVTFNFSPAFLCALLSEKWRGVFLSYWKYKGPGITFDYLFSFRCYVISLLVYCVEMFKPVQDWGCCGFQACGIRFSTDLSIEERQGVSFTSAPDLSIWRSLSVKSSTLVYRCGDMEHRLRLKAWRVPKEIRFS
jgi:hypothetical protein